MENHRHIISTNIVRDKDIDIHYIVTPNSKQIAHQIVNKFQYGQSCFSIIGSYGTGKSSFLWAFQKNLSNSKEYFFKVNGQFKGKTKFETINIVGTYESFSEIISKHLSIKGTSTEEILAGLSKLCSKLESEGKGLLIIVDEFGKILEFSAMHQPEKSMYFIQEFAEFCNDPIRDILFITTLHQNFGAYTEKLSFNQKQEWVKAKGRFEDLTFNEPVEQLLYLASQKIQDWSGNMTSEKDNDYFHFYDIAKRHCHLSNGLKNDHNLAEKLFPLEIIAATILTKALQKYGQNERSLFTFLSNNNDDGIIQFVKTSKVYSIIDVFDYVYNNYFSFLITTLNEDKNYWDSIRNTLVRIKNIFEKEYHIGESIIKLIGLANLLGEPGSKINDDFLIEYLQKIGIPENVVRKGIRTLTENKIIYFRSYSNRYVLTDGTDINYENELLKAGANINLTSDLVADVKQYFKATHEIARRISYEKGTSRFFEYRLTESPIIEMPDSEIDGIINIVFNDRILLDDLKKISKKTEDAIFHVYFPNTSIVKEFINDIKKINHVIREFSYDKVAVNELNTRKSAVVKDLNYLLNESIFNSNMNIVWFCQGDEFTIDDAKSLNKILSAKCNEIYSGTPIIRNELFNKHSYSSQISTARKSFIKNLLEHNNKELLGFSSENFPPEKTIYLSLLQKTGIHQKDSEGYVFKSPTDDSFALVWQESRNFLDSTKVARQSITTLINVLRKKPFRLKKGFIDFWIPSFLIIHRHEFALFNQDIYVPFITPDLMDLIWKNPDSFYIKCYNVDGVKLDIFNKYRELINKKTEENINQEIFIETIKPFLLFYRELPEYSKQTLNISSATVSLRNAIASSPDPETAFFTDFPRALGYNPNELGKNDFNLDDYVIKLQNCIREIRSSYDELIQRIDSFLYTETGVLSKSYQDFKNELIVRFESVDITLLASLPKKLLARIRSPYDDRKDFYNSISFVLMGKTLKEFTDNDEPVFYQSFINQFKILERIIPIHLLNEQRKEDKVFGIDITIPSGEKLVLNLNVKNFPEHTQARVYSELNRVLEKFDVQTRQSLLFNYFKNLIADES